jgi:hypothetical protein
VIGFYAAGTGTRSLTDGRFVGNTSYGVYATGNSATATNNWWGNAAGPGSGGADNVFGTVTWDPAAATDPEGGSVPAAPPALNVFLTGVQPASTGTGRAGAPQMTAAPPDAQHGLQAQAEYQARREEAQRRREEVRARANQRLQELRSKRPQ